MFNIFKRRPQEPKTWKAPRIDTMGYFEDMAKQPHALIGGTTGAGKSVALNGFMCHLMGDFPHNVKMMLIDPKGVELIQYKKLPHTIGHAVDPEEIEKALSWMAEEMDARFKEMMKKELRMTDKPDIYIVIDEYMDILFNCNKQAVKDLCRIAAKGRAAKIHIILCTQRPTRDVIDGRIKANFATILALRTLDDQESRNLIGVSGCEKLPDYGKAYYRTPVCRNLVPVDIPFVSDDRIKELVNHWTAQC